MDKQTDRKSVEKRLLTIESDRDAIPKDKELERQDQFH
jgi:hypothetical protein